MAGKQSKFLYYIRDVSTGLIKIGRADNLRTRLGSIRGMNPGGIVLLAVELITNNQTEKERHDAFAAHRAIYEWFRPHADLMAHIELVARSPHSVKWCAVDAEGVRSTHGRGKLDTTQIVPHHIHSVRPPRIRISLPFDKPQSQPTITDSAILAIRREKGQTKTQHRLAALIALGIDPKDVDCPLESRRNTA